MHNLYYLCVDFMIAFANLFDITYRDANLIILFGLLPGIIFLDVAFLISSRVQK